MSNQIALRLPPNILAKVDKEAAAMSRRLGFRVTRSDIVRRALDKYLYLRGPGGEKLPMAKHR